MSEIKGIKLTNGLEMVAKVIHVSDSHYALEDAFFIQVATGQDREGTPTYNIDFAPLTILGAPQGKTHRGFDLELTKGVVLFVYDLDESVLAGYRKITSPIDLSMAPSVR